MPICHSCQQGYDGDPRACPNCGVMPSQVRREDTPAALTAFSFMVGIVMSVIGCVGSLIAAIFLIAGLIMGKYSIGEFLFSELCAVASFFYSWAMCAVFSRVSQL